MSKSSTDSHISLIDLSKQLPFKIDVTLRKQICFAETLIISCAHCRGLDDNDYDDINWSLQDESDSSTATKESKTKINENKLEDEPITEEEEEEEKAEEPAKKEEELKGFQIYFFPECDKSAPIYDSKTSIIMENGFPKLNVNISKARLGCTCDKDEEGNCDCFTRIPCSCGAETVDECTCSKLKKICVCHGIRDPRPVCTCADLEEVCLCYPKVIKPMCPCDKLVKPCTCNHPNPHAICECKFKPQFLKVAELVNEEEFSKYVVIENAHLKEWDEGHYSEENTYEEDETEFMEETIAEQEPCVCTQVTPKNSCYCIKHEECKCSPSFCRDICNHTFETCTCEFDKKKGLDPSCLKIEQEPCPCEGSAKICKTSSNICECFKSIESKTCTCGDSDNCICDRICECILPCLCSQIGKAKTCICIQKAKQLGDKEICVCENPIEVPEKLKKVRATKQGYRWCHEVDPRHTFFSYAYGRKDKISCDAQVKEKVKILGLHEKIEDPGFDDNESRDKIKAPPYVKQPKKKSIDCCSALGGISISVEVLGEDESKFLVQVVSHSSKEGAKTGSKLISILDSNLHTLEENRVEYITNRDKHRERRSYMAICESGYYNKITRVSGDKHFVKRHYHTFEIAKNLLLEGANIMLMRYFALQRYKGTIKTDTVMIGGQICESIYVSQGVSQAIVNSKPLFVLKVERHIIEPSGSIHQTLTVLSLRGDYSSLITAGMPLAPTIAIGYIISHEWADNNYVMHINPLLNVDPEKDEIEPHAPLRERWREDLQLFSDYVDHKSMRISEGGRYMVESGELTGTIKDYLQTLLLLKPPDVLNFTRQYFGSVLSSLDLPYNDYYEPTKNVRYYYYEN